MITNIVQNLISKLPIDTKLVEFVFEENTDEDYEGDVENLEIGVKVRDISDIVQNDELACDIIINSFLACFGVDVASIARTKVEVADYRLIDARNLLINGYWKITDVTISGVTKKAYVWVSERFGYAKIEDFVNAIFRNVTDIMLSGNGDSQYNIIKIDDITYQMLKFIAFCYGANTKFTSFPLGNSETIHVEFDGWHFYEMLDKIGEVLEAEGYIADKTQVVHNQTLGQWFGDSIDWTDSDNPVFTSSVQCTLIIHKYANAQIGYNSVGWGSYVGVFPYGQGEDVWFYEIIISDSSYGNVRRLEYGEARQQNDCINAGNIYGQTGNNSWYYPIVYSNLVIYDDNDNAISLPSGANVPWWDIKCGRYYTMGYTGDILAQTTQRWASGIRPYLADSELNFYRTPNNEYLLQTPYPIYSDAINTLATYEYSTPMIGNEGDIVHEEVVPEPTVDHTILDDVEDIDLISLEGFRVFQLSIEALLEALRERADFYDTTVALKTEMIRTSTFKSIRDGKPLTEIKEDLNAKYANCSDMKIKYFRNSSPLTLQPFEWNSCFVGIEGINDLNDYLWNKSFYQKLRENEMGGMLPFDFVESLIRLPFDMRPDIDYESESHDLTLGGYTIDRPNIGTGNVQTYNLKNKIRILRSYPVMIGVNKSNNPYDTGTELDEENSKYKSKSIPSYLDYEPYTTATIYIPFVGERPLPMSKIMRQNVYLEYVVYIPTGEFVVNVYAYKYNASLAPETGEAYGFLGSDDKDKEKAYPILTATGNMAYSYKMLGKAERQAIQNVGNNLSTLSSVFGRTPNVSPMGLMGSLDALVNGNSVVQGGSSYNNVTQYLSNMLPYITLFHHEAISGYGTDKDTAFMQTIGKKSELGIAIKNMGKGFHKVKGVRLEGLNAPAECKEEIIRILESGFYKASEPSKET